MRSIYIDTLPGPTYFCGGLAYGNAASMKNKGHLVSPRDAALTALQKMKKVRDCGVEQWVLPPHPRPSQWALDAQSIDRDQLEQLRVTNPDKYAAFYSSAFVWTANSGIWTPSCDSEDGKCHMTPANCIQNQHRYMEADWTSKLWHQIVPSEYLTVHDPVPAKYPDEGAANIIRLDDNDHALWIAVYGEDAGTINAHKGSQFCARQSREALEWVQYQHGIPADQFMIVQQHPDAIQHGVFHNDVIAMGAGNRLILHENAFVNQSAILAQISDRFFQLTQTELIVEEVTQAQCDWAGVIQTYVFNSQLLYVDHTYHLIAPEACQKNIQSQALIRHWLESEIIHDITYVACDWSMLNGGGPACCRLHIGLNEAEHRSCIDTIQLTDARYSQLEEWITTHYPDHWNTKGKNESNEEQGSILSGIYQILGLDSLSEVSNT